MEIPSVEKLIPHRGLMVRLDRLLSWTPDEVAGEFTIKEGDPFLREGMLREASIVESIAQTVAAGQGYTSYQQGGTPPLGFLTGIEDFAYLRPVHAGDTLTLWAKVQSTTGPLRITESKAKVGEELVAQGTLKFFLRDSRP